MPMRARRGFGLNSLAGGYGNQKDTKTQSVDRWLLGHSYQ